MIYEYPEDRYNLFRWKLANKARFKRMMLMEGLDKGYFVIVYRGKDNKVVCYNVVYQELKTLRNWRIKIADTIRLLRRSIKHLQKEN